MSRRLRAKTREALRAAVRRCAPAEELAAIAAKGLEGRDPDGPLGDEYFMIVTRERAAMDAAWKRTMEAHAACLRDFARR